MTEELRNTDNSPMEHIRRNHYDHPVRTSKLVRPTIISGELCAFLDIPLEELMLPTPVMTDKFYITKAICEYAKTHGLLNGSKIHVDKRLSNLFPTLKEIDIWNLSQYLNPHFGVDTQSSCRILLKNEVIKQEMMELIWHPDRIQRLIAKHPGIHWNHEEQAYTELDFNSMADIL